MNRTELHAQQQPLKVSLSCTANGAHRHTGIYTHSSSSVRSRARSECIKALCSTTMVKAFPASRERFKRQDVKAQTCDSLARRCWPWREFAYRELIKRTRRFFTLRKPSGKQDREGGVGDVGGCRGDKGGGRWGGRTERSGAKSNGLKIHRKAKTLVMGGER